MTTNKGYQEEEWKEALRGILRTHGAYEVLFETAYYLRDELSLAPHTAACHDRAEIVKAVAAEITHSAHKLLS